MGEDMDLTWELSMKGYRVYCERKALCYPYDPPTGRIFVAQLDRWYRAYFQNLAVHWKGLLARNRRLGAFAIGYLVDGTLVLFLSLWTMLVALRASAVSALVLAMVFDVGIVSFFSIVEGVRLGRLWQVLASLPAYYVVRPVNVYVFWRSLWREWIRRDALRSWQKGH
jgi:cellulose synthase/poly-beta-1,6-N-acetylglucosamine synthase-like glycosyltransferase